MIEKCGGLQWQLRLVLFESMNHSAGMNITKWGHLSIILMFTEKPGMPVCSHSSFSNETTNWSMPLVQKSWNLCPGTGKSLCLWMCSGAIPYCWEKPGLRCSLMGTECSRGGSLRTGTGDFVLSVFLLAVGGWCLLPCYLHFSLCKDHTFSKWKRYCKPGTCALLCLHTSKWTSTIEWKISREMECFCSMLSQLKTEKDVYQFWFFSKE